MSSQNNFFDDDNFITNSQLSQLSQIVSQQLRSQGALTNQPGRSISSSQSSFQTTEPGPIFLTQSSSGIQSSAGSGLRNGNQTFLTASQERTQMASQPWRPINFNLEDLSQTSLANFETTRATTSNAPVVTTAGPNGDRAINSSHVSGLHSVAEGGFMPAQKRSYSMVELNNGPTQVHWKKRKIGALGNEVDQFMEWVENQFKIIRDLIDDLLKYKTESKVLIDELIKKQKESIENWAIIARWIRKQHLVVYLGTFPRLPGESMYSHFQRFSDRHLKVTIPLGDIGQIHPLSSESGTTRYILWVTNRITESAFHELLDMTENENPHIDSRFKIQVSEYDKKILDIAFNLKHRGVFSHVWLCNVSGRVLAKKPGFIRPIAFNTLADVEQFTM